MGALLVAALLIGVMRARSEQLIARLYEAARTDPLTGLLNRRGFRELLDLELERARRRGEPMALVVGDIDHFKEVNDRSGHPVGDAALRRTADLLTRGVRQIDAAARVGGEEFALVLSDTDDRVLSCWPSGCAARYARSSVLTRFRSPSASESPATPRTGKPPVRFSVPVTRRSTPPNRPAATER